MTSSIKPEVNDLSHCRQVRKNRATAAGITRTDNLVKFGHVVLVFEISVRTDRHTHTIVAILRTSLLWFR